MEQEAVCVSSWPSDQFITMAIPFGQQLHEWDLFRLFVYIKALAEDIDTHLMDSNHCCSPLLNDYSPNW